MSGFCTEWDETHKHAVSGQLLAKTAFWWQISENGLTFQVRHMEAKRTQISVATTVCRSECTTRWTLRQMGSSITGLARFLSLQQRARSQCYSACDWKKMVDWGVEKLTDVINIYFRFSSYDSFLVSNVQAGSACDGMKCWVPKPNRETLRWDGNIFAAWISGKNKSAGMLWSSQVSRVQHF